MYSNKIYNRIKKKGRGWVFCPKYFYDLTTRAVIDNSLSNLTRDNVIVRLSRGVYYYPSYNKYIGMAQPNADLVAKVYADSIGMNITYDGAKAANMLDLSMQVPSGYHYICDKKAMTKKIGKIKLHFESSYIARIRGISSKLFLMISALNYLGKDSIDNNIIKKCSEILDDLDKKNLLNISDNLSYWLRDIANKIAMS